MFFNTMLAIISTIGVICWLWSSRHDTWDDVRWLHAEIKQWWAARQGPELS